MCITPTHTYRHTHTTPPTPTPPPGVKISKNCQGSFGPLMSCLWGPSQSFKGPDFLISLMELITVSLSAQILRALRARLVLTLRPAKNFAGYLPKGPPYFNPCPHPPQTHTQVTYCAVTNCSFVSVGPDSSSLGCVWDVACCSFYTHFQTRSVETQWYEPESSSI